MRLTWLGPLDGHLLDGFECVAPPYRHWDDAVRELVSEYVPFVLARSWSSQVAGWWNDDELIGIGVLEPDGYAPGIWRSAVVAIRIGYQHRGHGRQFKSRLLDHARDSGAHTVISIVHRDNRAAIAMNESLHALVMADPDDPRREHFLCVHAVGDTT